MGGGGDHLERSQSYRLLQGYDFREHTPHPTFGNSCPGTWCWHHHTSQRTTDKQQKDRMKSHRTVSQTAAKTSNGGSPCQAWPSKQLSIIWGTPRPTSAPGFAQDGASLHLQHGFPNPCAFAKTCFPSIAHKSLSYSRAQSDTNFLIKESKINLT